MTMGILEFTSPSWTFHLHYLMESYVFTDRVTLHG